MLCLRSSGPEDNNKISSQTPQEGTAWGWGDPRPGSQASPDSSLSSTTELLPAGKLLGLIDSPVLTGVIMGLNEQLHSKCPPQDLEYSRCLLKAFPIPGYVKAFSYPVPLQPVHWKFPFLCSMHILSILKWYMLWLLCLTLFKAPPHHELARP